MGLQDCDDCFVDWLPLLRNCFVFIMTTTGLGWAGLGSKAVEGVWNEASVLGLSCLRLRMWYFSEVFLRERIIIERIVINQLLNEFKQLHHREKP